MNCSETWPIAPDPICNSSDSTIAVELLVNGQKHRLKVRGQDRLSSVLRNALGLTGLKEGCLEGECGACTVLLDDQPVNACLVLAFQADGRTVITVEGLENRDGSLSPLQQAFVDKGAIQCGYCTPGMVMAAKGLLLRNPHPVESEIRAALGGNLCRCTGFQNIVEAVKTVAEQ
ncbi:MAG: (2Fe-2S)-binding protein [Rhodobacteraceae bacterium]|nr:(2Fe-2S)-binding protein [Paracoccaceae bacterium]